MIDFVKKLEHLSGYKSSSTPSNSQFVLGHDGNQYYFVWYPTANPPTIAEIEAVELPQLPTVTEVTRYQIRTWLVLNYGPTILTQIDGMLAAIADETQRVLAQIAWESATVIRLTDPLTIQFGTALGLTESQMADAFEAASQIGV